MNLASIVDPHPADSVALVSRGSDTTYGTLRGDVASLRGGLRSRGVMPDDRVAIACGNNWYFVVSYLATLGLGAVAVPLNPLAPVPELTRELEAVDASVLIAGPTAVPAIRDLDRGALPGLGTIVTVGEGVLDDAVDLATLLAADPVEMVDVEPDDLAVLIFTSGTAGTSRAACLTHANLLANIDQVQSFEPRRQGPDDVVFGVLPLFHIFGLNVVLGLSLAAGSRILMVERFDPSTAIDSIVDHQVTIVTGPPTMWAAWAGLPGVDPTAFASVRLAVSGAAKLPVETAQAIEDRFGLHLDEGYGLTETSPVVTSATGTAAPWGSVGSPLPGIEVRLVDEDGEPALVGDPGELWVRGPNVFTGYWHDPDATAAALTPSGFLRTGDIGVVDDDGHLYLVDRAKDLIIVSGFNVYPAEVEEVLDAHPAVAACAVVGVPHPHSGEAVRAYVVVEPTASAEEDDLIAWCADRLARYKCPSKVLFVDELPQGPGGKVLRRALR